MEGDSLGILSNDRSVWRKESSPRFGIENVEKKLLKSLSVSANIVAVCFLVQKLEGRGYLSFLAL